MFLTWRFVSVVPYCIISLLPRELMVNNKQHGGGFAFFFLTHWIVSVYETCGVSVFFLATYTIFDKTNHMGKHKTPLCKKLVHEFRTKVRHWLDAFKFYFSSYFCLFFGHSNTSSPLGFANTGAELTPQAAPPSSNHVKLSVFYGDLQASLAMPVKFLNSPPRRYLSNEELHPQDAFNAFGIPGYIPNTTSDGGLSTVKQRFPEFDTV